MRIGARIQALAVLANAWYVMDGAECRSYIKMLWTGRRDPE